jgi:hypothetical protein
MIFVSDPRDIPRPAMFPMARPCRLTTQDSGRDAPLHRHRAYVDKNGNGMTDTVASHTHVVQNGVVLPSVRDQHDHKLSNVSCGTAGQGY